MRPYLPNSLGELEAMPEPQRSEMRRAIFEQVLGQMQAREEAKLDRDYEKVGTMFRYEIGE